MMMKHQAKGILNRLRLAANSIQSFQLFRANSLHQVARFSHFPTFLSPRICNPASDFYGTHHKKLFFSSESQPIVDEILSNNWLDEGLLSNALSHEAAMYLLMKLYKDPQKASDFLKWATEENGFVPSSAVYSLMLRIYAANSELEQFWKTIIEMKVKGFYLDEETYSTILVEWRNAKMDNDATALRHFYERMIRENAMGEVVEMVVDVVKDLDWGSEVERKLGEMGLRVTDNFVLRVLKELRIKGLRLRALSFFNWVGESLGFKHNSVTYNGILRILCKDESIKEFWGMVKEMQEAGYEIDIDTYIKIAREFQKHKMFEDAVQLYEHMMDSPFKPLPKECSLLLRVIAGCKDPDLDLVFRVVRKYEAAGFQLLKADYDGIHRSLTSAGNFHEAEKIVEAMRNAGYEPDKITYSQLIYGLGKARRLEEARDVLEGMETLGSPPDIMTWTILIKGYCVANEVDEALLNFSKMMEQGIEPDADLLEVLVQGFLNQNRVVAAHQLLTEMITVAHLKPWQSTFKNLIERLLGERRVEEALDLLRLMKKHKYPPHAKPFTLYIAKAGTIEDASEFLKALSDRQYPSVSAYKRILRSFFDEGRHSEANDLLFKLPHHIRNHPAITNLFGSSKSKAL